MFMLCINIGETNVQPREIPRSGSKAKDGERKREKEKKDRTMVITMASYALQRHLGWRTQSRLGQKQAGVDLRLSRRL